jgi:hypothetical protein
VVTESRACCYPKRYPELLYGRYSFPAFAPKSLFLLGGRTRATIILIYQRLTMTMGQFLTHLEPQKPDRLSHRFGRILILRSKAVWLGDVSGQRSGGHRQRRRGIQAAERAVDGGEAGLSNGPDLGDGVVRGEVGAALREEQCHLGTIFMPRSRHLCGLALGCAPP